MFSIQHIELSWLAKLGHSIKDTLKASAEI